MSTWTSWIAGLLALVFVTNSAALTQLAAPATARQEVPSAPERARSLRAIETAFAARLTGATTPEAKGIVARELYAAGMDSADDLVVRYALFDQAKDLAVEAGDDVTAMAALDQLQLEYDLGHASATKWVQLCNVLCKGNPDPQLKLRIVARLGALTNARVAVDDYSGAAKLAQAAVDAANETNEPSVMELAKARKEQIRRMRTEYAGVQSERCILEKHPNHRDANRITGRYYCFTKNRWSLGLTNLAKCDDANLRVLAEMELANPTTPGDQLALADGWWKTAQSEVGLAKATIRVHAARWYRIAQPRLAGLRAATARERLVEIQTMPDVTLVLPGDGIVERTRILEPQGFWCKDGARVLKYHLAVPALANGVGILEIIVGNMGDNSGDGGMDCELQDGAGTQVFRRFHKGFPTFRHEVQGDTSWTLVLEDHDTKGDGNQGAVEVWIVPQ